MTSSASSSSPYESGRHSLLSLVLEAQHRSAEQLSPHLLNEAADRLVDLAHSLGYPLLLPISREAERLVGAALVMGSGRINAVDASTVLAGSRVLLVDTVVVGTAGVANAAYFAEKAGARIVGAAVIDRLVAGDMPGFALHELQCA